MLIGCILFETNMTAQLAGVLLLLLNIQFDTAYSQCRYTLQLTADVGYSGKITSPNYPNNYDSSADCEWRIAASTGTVVVIIDDILLENRYDYLYFYDGFFRSNTVIGSYTSSTTGVEISSGSTILVRFISDSSVTRHGFKLTYFALYASSSSNLHNWPQSPCGSTITITTNDIQQLKLAAAPSNPSSSLANCDVTFQVPTDNLNVTILWSDLAFPAYGSNVTSVDHCDQQYGLSVWGGSSGSSLLYWLCNAELNSEDNIIIYPTQTSVRLRYNSPFSQTGPIISIQRYGGTAATASVPIPTTQSVTSSCGSASLIAEPYIQYVTSPNYPNDYSNDLRCSWTITSYDLTTVIAISIISLNTEPTHDYLFVYDGPSSEYSILGSKYTGSVTNVQLTSTSSYVTLYFYSDYSVTNSGFYISYYSNGTIARPACTTGYNQVDVLNATTTDATLYSHPGYLSGLSYDNGYVQYWLIKKPTVSDEFTFYFAAFRLESCSYDTLKVYKGACLSDPLEYTFCGELDLSLKYDVDNGQYVLLVMNTDNSVTYSGFEMHYYTTEDTSEDETDEDGIPLVAFIAPSIISFIVIIVVVFRVRKACGHKTAQKTTAKVSPPTLNNFKLTTTSKTKVPKQKPIRKKTHIVPAPPPDPKPSVPSVPPPQPRPGPPQPPAPYGIQDPAYPPPPPQQFGGSAPPMYQPYNNLNFPSNPPPSDIPSPFVYNPAY